MAGRRGKQPAFRLRRQLSFTAVSRRSVRRLRSAEADVCRRVPAEWGASFRVLHLLHLRCVRHLDAVRFLRSRAGLHQLLGSFPSPRSGGLRSTFFFFFAIQPFGGSHPESVARGVFFLRMNFLPLLDVAASPARPRHDTAQAAGSQ